VWRDSFMRAGPPGRLSRDQTSRKSFGALILRLD
jgi:hypothetical protein